LSPPPPLFGGFCFEFCYVNVPLFCFSVYLFVINVVLYTWNVGGGQNLTKTDIFNSVFFLWYTPLKLLYIQVLYVWLSYILVLYVPDECFVCTWWMFCVYLMNVLCVPDECYSRNTSFALTLILTYKLHVKKNYFVCLFTCRCPHSHLRVKPIFV
jgi:hypothetical protein